jgi:hypothetical protein
MSLEYAQKALEEYTKIEYAPGIRQAGSLVSLNQRELGVTTTTQPQATTTTLREKGITTDDMIMYAALTLAFIVILGLIVSKIRGK